MNEWNAEEDKKFEAAADEQTEEALRKIKEKNNTVL